MPPNIHLKIPDNHRASSVVKNQKAKMTFTSMITPISVELPAYIKSISQAFSPTWNKETVFGRMDNIATYQGTTRAITFGLGLPSSTLNEAKYALEAANLLASMIYPEYKQDVIAKPPLIRLNYANIISGTMVTTETEGKESDQIKFEEVNGERIKVQRAEFQAKSTSPKQGGLLGWIENFSWEFDGFRGYAVDGESIYPYYISLSFTFNVLHEETLSQSTLANNNWPFGGGFEHQ